MEFQRIFYADGAHDEVPVATVEQAGDTLVFTVGTVEVVRVHRDDLVTIEDR